MEDSIMELIAEYEFKIADLKRTIEFMNIKHRRLWQENKFKEALAFRSMAKSNALAKSIYGGIVFDLKKLLKNKN